MNDQLQAFPMTPLDIATAFLNHFEEEVEKRTKSMLAAQGKLAEALQLRDMAESDVRRAKAAVDAPAVVFPPLPLEQPQYGEVAGEISAIVNSGALDRDGVTVTASVSQASFTGEVAADLVELGGEYQRDEPMPTVDPITGEVAPPTMDADVERICEKCGGEGRLPDKTGGGHHRCRECAGNGHVTKTVAVPFVFAVYPGSGDSHKTPVGDRTLYGELVADYFSFAGIDGDVSEWEVVADAELRWPGGGGRNLTAPIQERDYGTCLIVGLGNERTRAVVEEVGAS